MKKLMRFHFHNLFRSSSFYAILGIMVLGPLLIGLLTDLSIAVSTQPDATPYLLSGEDVYNIFKIYAAYPILAFIELALVANEDFSSDVAKTVLGRGYRKSDFFFSKWIVAFSSYLTIMLLARLVPTLLISLGGGLAYDPGSFFYGMAWDFAGDVVSGAFALFFAFLARKSASSIILAIACPIALLIPVELFDLTIRLLTMGRALPFYPVDFVPFSWTSFNPGSVSVPQYVCAGVSIAFSLAFSLLIGWLCARKRDLK
ncbi:MAG: ABC transporter permease [Candidatus Enteromonas sp.]